MTWSGTFVSQVPQSSPFKNGAWIYHDIDPYQAAAPNGLIMASCQQATNPQYSSDVQPCDTPTTKAACEAAPAGCAC